jgi:hypothetical protein
LELAETTDQPVDMFSAMSLESFLSWVLNQPLGLMTLMSQESYWHESVITQVIFRYDRFQVELVILRGDSTWPGEHRHPDVDSVEVDLNNSVVFTKNGEKRNTPDFQVPVQIGQVTQYCNCVRLLPTDSHGICEVAPGGAAILSVQEWLNGVAPSSVGLNWDGVPVSFGHQNQLETIVGAKHVHSPS